MGCANVNQTINKMEIIDEILGNNVTIFIKPED